MICSNRKLSKPVPASCTSFTVNLLGVFIFFTIFFILKFFAGFTSPYVISVTGLIGMSLFLWEADVLRFRVSSRASAGLRGAGAFDFGRVRVKLLGLFGTFVLILAAYRFIPEYQTGFYLPYFYFLKLLWPWVLLISFVYVTETDRRQEQPLDAYWHFGRLLSGRLKDVDRAVIAEHLRQWTIKGFFLPLMFVYLTHSADFLFNYVYPGTLGHFARFYSFTHELLYCVDLLYACLGYMMTFRVLDTHIRSAEPTFLGWAVTLFCYNPFFTFFQYRLFVHYNDGHYFQYWFNGHPAFYIAWGAVILLTLSVYVLATVALGYRFSNLTYRGLVTSGPYRFTKHPAYIAKSLTWWMISMPFLSTQGPGAAARNCFVLAFICFIYYVRARTEENHLSNYPEYVAYAEWMNEHGIFSFISKRFPALKYSKEKCAAWGSTVWWRKK